MSAKRENQKNLEEKGWVIIKNVFTKAEVEELRNKVQLSDKQGYKKGDLLSNPNLENVVYDDRILKIISEVLGSKPIYFGDSSYQIASVVGRISSGFHKDNVDRDDQNGPDWKSPYTIVRVGIYLQDHARHSEGLILRTGSHKYTDLTKGKKINAPTEPGDIVIWYLTTSHSGNAKRIKLFNYPVLGFDDTHSFKSLLYFRIQRFAPFLIQKSEKDRMALFLTFGLNDKHLERYLTYMKTRRYAVEAWKDSKYSPELLNKIKDKNFTFINMNDVVKDIKLEEVKSEHVPTAY